MNKIKFSFNHIIKVLCIGYLIVGILLWAICFFGTNWDKLQPLCCYNCDRIWYSELWEYYYLFTLPFMFLTFPIVWLVYDSENIIVWSIISVYLPTVPFILLWLFNKIFCKRH